MTSADVVVVGGGICGCACAYYLARHGVRVVIVERDGIAAHASGFAFGGLNPLSGAGIPGPMSPLAMRAFALHVELAEALTDRAELGFRRRPTVHLAFAAGEARGLPWKWKNAQPGFHAELLNGEEARRLEPRIAADVVAAEVVHGTAEVDPFALAEALAAASKAPVRKATVTGIDMAGNRATGVRLGAERIACGAVILATGPWRRLAEQLGFALPLTPLKGEILRLEAAGEPVAQSIGWRGNYVASKPDGLLWAGTTETVAGFDAKPTIAARLAILSRLRRMLPAIEGLRLRQQTACLRPMTSDGLAVLGRAPGWENVYLATGGGRKGVLYGPAMGAVLADLVAEGTTASLAADELEALAPERFTVS